MSLVPLVLLLSSSLVFYHTYRHVWFHIIKIFESNNKFNSKYADNNDPDLNNNNYYNNNNNNNSFIRLISSDDLSISNQRLIDYLKKIARIAFATSLTSSFLVVEFILYQFMNNKVNEQEDQEVHKLESMIWKSNLFIITLNLVVIHPILITVLLINKFFKSKILNNLTIKFITTLIIFIIWCIFISNFDSFTDLDIIDSEESNIFAYCLLRISIIGITLIAILNGIGSFSTAYYQLFKRSNISKQIFTQEHLLSLEKTLQNTNNMIKQKEEEFEKQQSLKYLDDGNNELNKRPNIQSKSSFLGLDTLKNPFKKDTHTQLSNDLNSEINSLKIIKNDIYLKLLKIEKQIIDNTNNKNSKIQLIKNIIQLSLSIYCTFKILQVSSIKLFSLFRYQLNNDLSTKESDPLVLTIAKTLQLIISVQDEEFLINQLSFIVSGALFLGSINGVFMTFQHLYKFLPLDLSKLNKTTTQNTKFQSVSIIKNLLISELTGIYTLATILILKSNLTSSFNSKLNSLLSITNQNLSITQLDNWFDKMFLVSVIITAISIKIAEFLSEDIEGFEDQTLVGKIV